MKICKFAKLKNGQYKILLEDDTFFIVHEELILKYDLLIQKKISLIEKEKIMEENGLYIAYDMALKYLTKKMRCEYEVCEYLRKQNVDNIFIDNVIEKLKGQGYLSEESFVRAYYLDRINFSSIGPKKIENELVSLNISKDVIERCKNLFTSTLEIERIEKIVKRMIKSNRTKSEFLLKRKIQDYLLNNGYSLDLILDVLKNIEVSNSSSIQKKEYDKIYRKLSRKYSGKELEYKIKQKMYALGFKNDVDE